MEAVITPIGRWGAAGEELVHDISGRHGESPAAAGPGVLRGESGRGAGFPKSCRMQVSWGDGGEPHCSDGPWGGRYSRAPGTARFCFLKGRFRNTLCVSCLRASPRLLRAPALQSQPLSLLGPGSSTPSLSGS